MSEQPGVPRDAPSNDGGIGTSARQHWFEHLDRERERNGWTFEEIRTELGLQSKATAYSYFNPRKDPRKKVIQSKQIAMELLLLLSRQPGYAEGIKALRRENRKRGTPGQRDPLAAVSGTEPIRRGLPLWQAALYEQLQDEAGRREARVLPKDAKPQQIAEPTTVTDPQPAGDTAETINLQDRLRGNLDIDQHHTLPSTAPDRDEAPETLPDYDHPAAVPIAVPAVPRQPPPLLTRLAAHPVARLIGHGLVFVITGPRTAAPQAGTTWSARLGRRLDRAARMFVGALAIFAIMIVIVVVRYHPDPGPGDNIQIPQLGDPSITPAVSLHPDHGIPGATLTLDGDGFRPGESIEITVSGSAISTDVAGLYTGQTDNNGHLQLQIQVPDPPPSTQCEVLAAGARSLAFAVTTLTVDPAPHPSHT